MKKFAVITNPRTGSEFVCKMLDSHPEICCYSELFSLGNTGKDWNDSQYKAHKLPFDYLNNLFKAAGKKFCGYKQLSFWMNNACFANCREFIQKSIEHDYIFIFLERSDLFKSYVSYMIMCDYQYGHLEAIEEPTPKLHTIKLSPEEAFVNVRSWRGFNIYTKEMLKKYKAQHIVINYEEDFIDTVALRNKLFAFLGVNDFPVAAPLKKTNPFNVEELVENYFEVTEYFNNRNRSFRKEQPL